MFNIVELYVCVYLLLWGILFLNIRTHKESLNEPFYTLNLFFFIIVASAARVQRVEEMNHYSRCYTKHLKKFMIQFYVCSVLNKHKVKNTQSYELQELKE